MASFLEGLKLLFNESACHALGGEVSMLDPEHAGARLRNLAETGVVNLR
jgi:hypothetical protein